MKKSKLMKILAAALAAMMVLSACGGGQSGTAETTAAAAPAEAATTAAAAPAADGGAEAAPAIEPCELTYWYWADTPELAATMEEIIADFNSTNEYGITVKGEQQN